MFFLIMALISAAVVARYFFFTAIPGSIEMVQLLQVIAVGLCLGYAQRMRANVRVDLFVGMLPLRARAALEVLNSALAAAVFLCVTYGIYKIASTTGAMRETTDTHGLPLYPFKWLLSAGFGILSLQLIADFLRAIAALRNGTDPYEAPGHATPATGPTYMQDQS